jgi:hypothetical protein
MSGAGKGAITGATLGATIGAIFGGDTGALLGAYVGTLFGAIAGDFHDKRVASRAEAARKYTYNFKRELLLIEKAVLDPPNYVTRGSMIDAHVIYTVLAPNPKKNLTIIEKRTLLVNGKSIPLAKRRVSRMQGTYISTLRISVPRDIPSGTHILITVLSIGQQTRVIRIPLKVA